MLDTLRSWPPLHLTARMPGPDVVMIPWRHHQCRHNDAIMRCRSNPAWVGAAGRGMHPDGGLCLGPTVQQRAVQPIYPRYVIHHGDGAGCVQVQCVSRYSGNAANVAVLLILRTPGWGWTRFGPPVQQILHHK
jgi:hypothetical protein